MNVIVISGNYNSGKTIIARMLYAQMVRFNSILKNTPNENFLLDHFEKETLEKISSGARKNVKDFQDFSNYIVINEKVIYFISHSVYSDEFRFNLNIALRNNPFFNCFMLTRRFR